MPAHQPAILVVDDEVDACRNLQDILTDFGYRTDIASTASEAVRLVKQNPYDVVLLDLKMPDVTGLSLYEQIRECRADAAAILVTAFASPETQRQAVERGVTQVLSKPVDVPQLIREIGQTLDQPLLLIVDDDHDLRHNLSDLLRHQGFRVAMAQGTTDAAEQLRARDFRVVLVDLKLAQGSGREVLELVKSHSPHSKTLLITGNCGELSDELVQSVEGRANVCLKPFDVPVLLRRIEELVGNQSRASA